MTRYLVVAHQTVESPELIFKLSQLARSDPESEFALLVPTTRIEHLATWTEGESEAVAASAAQHARDRLESEGITVSRMIVGDESPLLAVDDEMRKRPDAYDAIVVSTFPLGISRWLRLDLPHLLERKYPLPVIHVVAQREEAPARTRE